MKIEETDPLIRWIVSEGLQGTPETRLLDGLCEHLVSSGLPLLRVNISQPTLHPVIGGHLFFWQRSTGASVQEDWQRNVAAAGEDYARTPFEHMMTGGVQHLRCRLIDGEGCDQFPLLDRFRSEGATDYIALQTDFGEAQSLGPARHILTSWQTDAPEGFVSAHLETIERLAPVLALAVKSTSTYRIASSVIETYLGRNTGRRVLGGTIERGAGEMIRAAIWYSDLEGFTKLADTAPKDELLGLMHDYFECMVTTVHEHQGEVLKFIGDGLLAMFNLDDDDASCRAALEAADRLSERVAELSDRRRAAGLPVTRYSLALHLGEVLYGNIGARDRLDFTVVGPAVNEASRIEAMCRALDQELIISSDFAQVAKASSAKESTDRLFSLGRYVLRGVRKPQELFTLVPREFLDV
ncbi:MAG: adenylate/guanylate cyclase domain-containing protein [Kiloniellales bacterium]|nr:adenylate/guanylate cyclase domain-containing protein [Kiloniellales bacterium]